MSKRTATLSWVTFWLTCTGWGLSLIVGLITWDPLSAQPLESPSIESSPSPSDPPVSGSAADLRQEIRSLRQEVIRLLMRVEVLEAELERQSLTPTLQPSTSAVIEPTIPTLPTLEPSPPPSSQPPEDPPTIPSSTLEVGTQTISLPGDVLFDFDKAEIRPEAASLLQKVADSLRDMPNARILVAGHTDNIGEDNYNLVLSLERANAVKDYLIKLLPSGNTHSWVASGFGASQPVADNQTATGRQRNRRVDLVIAP
ncbi:MAG: OmpA family protein [Cyanobacteriota bacterium]|nr:OmpA family protein [Cyanobacteriota bacterium]